MSILNNFLRTYVANAMKLSKNNLQEKLRLEVIKDLSNKFQELIAPNIRNMHFNLYYCKSA